MWEMQGMPNIPQNVLKHSRECPQTFLGILPNFLGECPQTFWGMSSNITGDFTKTIRGMSSSILGNASKYSGDSKIPSCKPSGGKLLLRSSSSYNKLLGRVAFKIQASAYEKQGRATIAHLATKFRGYRRVKNLTPPTKQACGGVR